MSASVSLSTTALSELVRGLLPDPDAVGPWGPAGTVVSDYGWVMLNPQPLPPRLHRWGPSPDPWHGGLQPDRWRWGSQPDPWVFAAAVRAAVGSLLAAFEQAGIIVVGGDVERTAAGAQRLSALVDDFCAVPPRRRPFPGPWGPLLDEPLDGRSLAVAGALFQQAVSSLEDTHALATPLADGAERLFGAAVQRLAG